MWMGDLLGKESVINDAIIHSSRAMTNLCFSDMLQIFAFPDISANPFAGKMYSGVSGLTRYTCFCIIYDANRTFSSSRGTLFSQYVQSPLFNEMLIGGNSALNQSWCSNGDIRPNYQISRYIR